MPAGYRTLTERHQRLVSSIYSKNVVLNSSAISCIFSIKNLPKKKYFQFFFLKFFLHENILSCSLLIFFHFQLHTIIFSKSRPKKKIFQSFSRKIGPINILISKNDRNSRKKTTSFHHILNKNLE